LLGRLTPGTKKTATHGCSFLVVQRKQQALPTFIILFFLQVLVDEVPLPAFLVL
jgi:hypothetical protein